MIRSLILQARGALTLLALILILSILLGFVRSDDPILIIFDNLRVHAAGLLIVVAVTMLPLRAGLRGLAFAGVGVAVLVLTVFELGSQSEIPTGESAALKVISFNLLNSNSNNGGRIAEYLVGSGADIVFVQESLPIQKELDALAKTYPYQAGCGAAPARCGDVLVLSTRPLENVAIASLEPDSAHQLITADVVLDGKMIHLVAIHLVRPNDGSTQVQELANLSRKIAGTEGMLILAGDFNATPWFRPFAGLLAAGGLRRAAFEPGTWPVPLGDWAAPIDHILLRPPLRFAGLRALPDNFGSNHRGLMAEIGFTDAP